MPNARVLPVPVLAWPMMSLAAERDRQGQRLDREGGRDALASSAAQMGSAMT